MSVPLLQALDVVVPLTQDRRVQASFDLRAGMALQVAGPSGAGKTTLLRALARLNPFDGGKLLLRGQSADQVAATQWRRQVVYVAQHPTMLEGSVSDNLAAGFRPRMAAGSHRSESEGRRLLEELGMEPTNELLAQSATTLSGGEAARVALCRALLIKPAVLLTDEPTANLDATTAAAMVQLISGWIERGGALVLVAHDETPWTDLDRGQIGLER